MLFNGLFQRVLLIFCDLITGPSWKVSPQKNSPRSIVKNDLFSNFVGGGSFLLFHVLFVNIS